MAELLERAKERLERVATTEAAKTTAAREKKAMFHKNNACLRKGGGPGAAAGDRGDPGAARTGPTVFGGVVQAQEE